MLRLLPGSRCGPLTAVLDYGSQAFAAYGHAREEDMGELIFYALISLTLLLLSLRFFFQKAKPGLTDSASVTIAEFLPVHHREFEEVEHRLGEYDALLQSIDSERRELALGYLGALRDDFIRVEQLLNHAAKFLPDLTLQGEGERLWLGIRFGLAYRVARIRTRLGFVPSVQIAALTQQVRLLAQVADEALNLIAHEYGLPVLQSDLNTTAAKP